MPSRTPTGCASTPTRSRTWIWTFGVSYAFPCTIETYGAEDWIRTSMSRPVNNEHCQDRRLSQSSHVGVNHVHSGQTESVLFEFARASAFHTRLA